MARGALELMVKPGAGQAGSPAVVAGSFLATCSLGFKDPMMPTGVWASPNPDEMCAVAGGYAYLVDTTAPERVTQIPLRPVTEVRSLVPEGLLLFAGFTHLVAWAADGLRWTTGRLSWEGLTLGEVVGGRLLGTGWEMLSDKELPFSVDLQTGAYEGGGYLR